MTAKNPHDHCSKQFVCDNDDEGNVFPLKYEKVNKTKDVNKVHHWPLRTCAVVHDSMLNRKNKCKMSSNRRNNKVVTSPSGGTIQKNV